MSSDPSSPVDLIIAERLRQIGQEGWTPAHDDAHAGGELAAAAGSYALVSVFDTPHSRQRIFARYWPWGPEWFKPSDDPIRNLVKAGALIVAEIERLQRAKERS